MAPGAARGWLWRRQALPGICHPALLHGGDRVRTDDPLLAKQALSQLSYAPAISDAISDRPVASSSRHGPNMGQGGLEPPTPRLSSVCSNQLSYWPKPCGISRRSLPLSPAPQGGPRTWKDARLAPRLCRRSLAARCRRWRGSGIWVCERRARLLRALAEFGTTRAFARACRFCQDHSQQAPSLELTPRASSLKGGDPAAGSPTATLLRLHPSHQPHRGDRLPKRLG